MDLRRQGVAVGKYTPKFDCVQQNILASTFSNGIPFISDNEKSSMFKFAKLQTELNSETAGNNVSNDYMPIFKDPPSRPDPF